MLSCFIRERRRYFFTQCTNKGLTKPDLQEKNIEITELNPIELYGVNDRKINLVKTYFPHLKVIARGNTIKVMGQEEEINRFEAKIALFVKHFMKYNRLTESNIENLMQENGDQLVEENVSGDEVLVYGVHGIRISPKTVNQRKLVETVRKNDMVFAVGPAGTGKTYTAVALAVQALKNKDVRRIILTRPAVEAGENLGFLPGDLKEKLDPYLQPLYDGLRDMIPAEKLKELFESEIIQIAPLAFMRGRTLDKAFVILDEAQNATAEQMKMFLTRMGKNAKFVITGDMSQIDLPRKQQSGLVSSLQILKGVKGIGIVKLDGKDVMRHKLVRKIIDAFDVNSAAE